MILDFDKSVRPLTELPLTGESPVRIQPLFSQAKHRQLKQQRQRPSSLNDAERLRQNDDADNVARKFSFRVQRRSDGVLSYVDDERHSKPTYTDTKASILRRSKNVKPEVTSSLTSTNLGRTRKSTFNRLISSSLSDLRAGHDNVGSVKNDANVVDVNDDYGGLDDQLRPGELVRQNSTPSNLGV